MADSVTSWKSGQNPTPGVPSVGYPYCEFNWNVTADTNSGADQKSEAFAYPGRYFTLAINTAGDAVDTNDIVYTLYGSNNSDLAIAKWDTVKTATIANAAITNLTTYVEVSTENDEALYKFYKLGLNPAGDVGPECTIRVGINAPSLGIKG